MHNDKYSIFDDLMEGVQIISKDWHYLYVNNAVALQARIPKEKLLDYTMMEKYPGIEKTEMFIHIDSCLKFKKAKRFLNEFTFPDGRTGVFDLSIQSVPEGVLILSVDVTGQHMTLKELKRNNEQLRMSQQLALLGSFEYYIKQDKITWSETTFIIMGRDFQLGEPTVDEMRALVHPDDLNSFDSILSEALEKGISYTNEYRIVLPGGIKHLRSIAKTVFGKDGKLERVEGCVQDITKKKHTEIALANREKNYRLLFEGVQESFIVHEVIKDNSGKIADLLYTEINPVTEKTLGRKREEVIGKTRSQIIGPLDSESISIVEQVLKGESVRRERYVPSLDKWFDIFIYSPQPGQIATLNLDVTTRKKAEQQLQQLNIELEERIKERTHEIIAALEREKALNEMKSQFVTIASHEFRTPLTTLLSSTFLIEQFVATGQTEHVNKHIKRIKESVTNMTSILEDFLSLEKLELGKIELRYEKLNVSEFIFHIVEKLNTITRPNQSINYTHTGVTEISTDGRLLQNILTNLVSNAIKYSQDDVTIVTETGSGNLKMKVSDLGIGIPEQDQSQVFEMFFRASNVSNIQGTGLGLNLVKRYVDLLGGSLSFTSKQDEGTSFTVTLPAKAVL